MNDLSMTPALAAPGSEPVASPMQRSGEAEPCLTVDVFGMHDERSDIAAVLERLGYAVRLHKTEATEPLLPPTEPAPDAAVVIDDGPDALACCASLAGRCPVILASSDDSFEFRLAAARAHVKACCGDRPARSNWRNGWGPSRGPRVRGRPRS